MRQIVYGSLPGVQLVKGGLAAIGLRGGRAGRAVANALRPFPRVQWAFANLSESHRGLQLAPRDGPLRGLRVADLLLAEANAVWRNLMEPVCSTILESLDLRGATVFDVGGCYGYHALMFGRQVGPAGRVYTFEPDAPNAARLVHNIRLNHLENVVVEPFAVGASTGMAAWHADAAEPWNAHLSADQPTAAVIVPVTTLDDFVARMDRPDLLRLIKIDVEGLETEVLRGSERVLKELRPIVLCELHSPENATGCEAFLSAHEYTVKLVEYLSSTRQHIFAWPNEMDGPNRRALARAPLAAREAIHA